MALSIIVRWEQAGPRMNLPIARLRRAFAVIAAHAVLLGIIAMWPTALPEKAAVQGGGSVDVFDIQPSTTSVSSSPPSAIAKAPATATTTSIQTFAEWSPARVPVSAKMAGENGQALPAVSPGVAIAAAGSAGKDGYDPYAGSSPAFDAARRLPEARSAAIVPTFTTDSLAKAIAEFQAAKPGKHGVAAFTVQWAEGGTIVAVRAGKSDLPRAETAWLSEALRRWLVLSARPANAGTTVLDAIRV